MDYAAFEKSGYWLTVAEVNARYKVPARYAQLLTARCWIESLKSRSVVFGYEIIDAEMRQVLVTGHTKHICIDHQGRVARLPETWLNALAEDE